MKIAILGSNSQVAKSLIHHLGWHDLRLFCRAMENYDKFGNEKYDIVINCVGISQPSELRAKDPHVVPVTEKFDRLVLKYLPKHPKCKYIYFSSGIVNETSYSTYRQAKVEAEARHRASKYNCIDLRLYSFFSRYINLSSQFFIAEALRCMKANEIFKLSSIVVMRDYPSPLDIAQFILKVKPGNRTYELFSKLPISTFALADLLKERGLKYILTSGEISPTGIKQNFYPQSHDGFTPKYTSLDVITEELEYFR